MDLIKRVVGETLATHGGGVKFFDSIDAAWRLRRDCAPVLDEFFGRVLHEYYGYSVISTGRFGVYAHNSSRLKLAGKHVVLVGGGLRTGAPADDLEYIDAYVRNRDFVLLDDSYYSGTTRAAIARELARSGASLRETFVIYDGSPVKDPYVKSLYRYYDHYRAGNIPVGDGR